MGFVRQAQSRKHILKPVGKNKREPAFLAARTAAKTFFDFLKGHDTASTNIALAFPYGFGAAWIAFQLVKGLIESGWLPFGLRGGIEMFFSAT